MLTSIVTGDHAFQMPDWDAGDVRGPCPGLNVLANHGYLPRNGVASLLEYGTATSEVLGMGIVISAVLGVYGTALGGNLVALDPSVSMGGYSVNAPQNAIDNLGGLLGKSYLAARKVKKYFVLSVSRCSSRSCKHPQHL